MAATSPPFGGAISLGHEEARVAVRRAIDDEERDEIVTGAYPCDERMPREECERALGALEVELVRLRTRIARTEARVAVFLGAHDVAGKGGAISRPTMSLDPRVARPAHTEREATRWRVRRHAGHLPSGGEMTIRGRSRHDRGVVEKAFGFADDLDRAPDRRDA